MFCFSSSSANVFGISICLFYNLIALNSQYIPEYFNPATSNVKEVSRKYSNYVKPNIRSANVKNTPIISNLHSHLEIFGQCLVHVINYEGVDITPGTFPIVLSRYDVVHSTYLVYGDLTVIKKYMLASRSNLHLKEEIPSNISIEIPLCKRNWIHFECPHIPYKRRSSSAKPWQCEAHFYLQSPFDPAFYSTDKPSGYTKLLIPGSCKTQFCNMEEESQYEYNIEKSSILITTRPCYDILLADRLEENTLQF